MLSWGVTRTEVKTLTTLSIALTGPQTHIPTHTHYFLLGQQGILGSVPGLNMENKPYINGAEQEDFMCQPSSELILWDR